MKKSISLFLKLGVTISIFIIVFVKFDIKVLDIIMSVHDWQFLLLALFLRLFVNPIIFINRWKLFLKHSGVNENFFTLLKISFISAFLGVALPSSQGSDVVRMVMIEKKHKGFTENKTASSSVIIERMIGFILLALIGLISSVLVPSYHNKEKIVLIISLINLFLLVVMTFMTNKKFYSFLSAILLKIKFMKGMTSFIEKTHYSLVTFPYKKVLLPSIILILLLQISSILIVYLVFLAFNVHLPFYQHLSFYPIIAILSIIPIAISGLGLREGFFVYFYSLVGISPEIAVGVSLVNYCIEVLSAAMIGGILYFLKSINIIKD